MYFPYICGPQMHIKDDQQYSPLHNEKVNLSFYTARKNFKTLDVLLIFYCQKVPQMYLKTVYGIF